MARKAGFLKRWSARRPFDRPRQSVGFDSGFESLESRLMPAVTAVFAPTTGVLSVFGDNQDNTIEISRNAAGALLVNGGAVPIVGGAATVANTALIQVFGQSGNDTITLNEASGALPAANLFGGSGDDTLVGGSGADLLFGQAGNDILLGRSGNDFLFGGAGNDTLTGGDGDDQVFGESGDDRMIWNPGDDTDLNEGGAGTDTVEVNGGNGAENFTVTANGARVRFDRVDPAPFSIDIGTSENLVLNANGGNDSFSATGNLAALIKITVDGGAGNDTLLGSNGNDLLLGGDGDDFVDGNQGTDVAFLGAGDDVFQWDPGDGSDTVEGQDGTDRLVFNGSGATENFGISANGGRILFTRDVGSIVMDLNDVETIDVNALGGPDTVTINDVSGTDLVQVNLNLAGTLGGTTGDGQIDRVIVNGTNGGDSIQVVGAGTSYSVVGLPAQVSVTNSEPTDQLVVNALGGNDTVSASTLPGGITELTLDGGAGNDTLLGSQGRDVLLGGAGNDFALGDGGDDLALLGAGDDVFQWDPGDGNDTVEGQDGSDRLVFNGANIGESIDISANGGRVLLVRNIANVTMDLDDVERIDVVLRGGADTVAIGDLAGTDVTQINLDLAGVPGTNTGDGQADTVTVNGTAGADLVHITGSGTSAAVTGLTAAVNITGSEGALDRLIVNGQGGNDTLDASGLAAGVIGLQLNGGLGADVLIGSQGDDLVNGGDGDDVAFLGAGDDVFVWNPGDDNDTVEGQAGSDTLVFNGANVAESFDISANGGRIRLTRNVANIVMDLDDVEQIDVNALGGADVIVVNDVSGTDLTEINVNLAAAGGVGDGQLDNVIVNATNGDDVAVVVGDATGVSTLGLAAVVNITGAEAANDRLTVNLRAGDDVLEASGLAAGAIQLTGDGGAGDDVLIGGAGNDVLAGGPGDDVLIGGPGVDILDGGPGDNILIQG